jgi:hypothetical protein
MIVTSSIAKSARFKQMGWQIHVLMPVGALCTAQMPLAPVVHQALQCLSSVVVGAVSAVGVLLVQRAVEAVRQMVGGLVDIDLLA